MDIDPSLSARDNLLALIKHDYDLDLSLRQAVFEPPRSYHDPSGRNRRNTEIAARYVADTGSVKTITFKYWRVDLYQYNETVVDVTGSVFDTIDGFKYVVCERLGIIAEEVDILDPTLPEFTPFKSSHSFSLIAKTGSLTYFGTFDLTVTMDVGVDLSNLLGNGVLDGFEPTNITRDEQGVPVLTETGQYIWV